MTMVAVRRAAVAGSTSHRCLTRFCRALLPDRDRLTGSLRVQEQQIDGQWDIALRDLDFAIGLDADQNGELTWDEVRAKHKEIAANPLSRQRFISGYRARYCFCAANSSQLAIKADPLNVGVETCGATQLIVT